MRRGRGMMAAALALAFAATGMVGAAAPPGELLLIGTHTAGPGQGVYAARLDPATGALTPLGLAAEVERPTWLHTDPSRSIVYATSETGNDGVAQGGVYSLRVDPRTGKAAVIGQVASGGGGATHLDYDARSQTVFVANYGTGHVAAIPVRADGGLDPVASVRQDVGSGPSKRQTSAHAHGVAIDPSGRFVLVADLGADRLFVYRFDPATRALLPARTPGLAFPAGSGPRHLVFSKDGRWLFVDTELTGQVFALRWDARAGTASIAGHVDLDPPGTVRRSAAELALSGDGRFLYVSNRGSGLMQVFAIDPDTGGLTERQRIAAGSVPWSFAIDPSGRWLIVTDEAASTLSVFAVDRPSGRLTATSATLAVPKPVTIAFVPPAAREAAPSTRARAEGPRR